jgi:hypothetical protein
LTNDTFTGNATNDTGGAILDAGPGDLALLNDTLNGNAVATNGGGIALTATANLSLQNTIVALNTAVGMGNDVFTGSGLTVIDKGGNLIGTLTGASGFGAGTLTGNPNLGPLQNNGGQFAGASATRQIVQTEALHRGSPAIGEGVLAGSPTTDERGFPHPGGGATNPSIGAYEPQFSPNATANQVFVESLYEVLLNRPADAAGAAFFSGLLNKGVGAPTVIQLIESSLEYRDDVVQSLYQRYLDRAADAGGLNAYARFLGAGGTIEQVEQSLTSSSEYYLLHGGTNEGFLQGLYNDGLGRTIDPGTDAWFNQELTNGMSRSWVATQVFSSQEYETDLILADYESYLGRVADTSGLSVFVNVLKQGVTDQLLTAFLLGSQESFGNRT